MRVAAREGRQAYRKNKYLRAFACTSLLTLVLFVGVPFYRYNTFIFKRAAKEARKAVERLPAKPSGPLVKHFGFPDQDALKEWEEKVFKGRVVYTVEAKAPLSYVRAKSAAAASALYYKITIDAKKRQPVVGWKWSVVTFPAKKGPENLEKQNEDDFAARVYVIFPAAFFTNSKVLEYVWAETLPVGTTGPSPYSPNIQIIVLRSGPAPDGAWFDEERDIIADYQAAFKRKPEYNIGAVAFMTNTEHTGSTADAMYDEIRLSYKDETTSVKGGRP